MPESGLRRPMTWAESVCAGTFDCKGNDQFVGAYFDDQLGSAAQMKYAKDKGVWPF
jgi:hypothetical protein